MASEFDDDASYFLRGISVNGVPLWKAENRSEAMAFPFNVKEDHGSEIEEKIEEINPEQGDTLKVSFLSINFDDDGEPKYSYKNIESDWGVWDIEDFWSNLWEIIREVLGYKDD